MKTSLRPRRAFLLAATLLLPVLGACQEGLPSSNDNQPPEGCVPDGVCDEVAGESCFTCASDCCVQCNLISITPSAPRDYLVSAMHYPTSNTDGLSGALDLDGDGEPDNKAGGVTSLFVWNGAAINEHVDRRIRDGELLLVLRVYADDLREDDEVLVQLLPAEIVDATPLFDGGDVVGLRRNPAEGGFGCGTIRGGTLTTDPALGTHSLPSPMGAVDASTLAVHGLRISGDLSHEQLHDVVVAGAITQLDVKRVLFAELAELLNEAIRDDPDSELARLFGTLLDGQCAGDRLPGCADAIYGEGECDATVSPVHISATEVRCNELMHVLSEPDVDLDGDGDADHVSVAWRIHAVPVTVLD